MKSAQKVLLFENPDDSPTAFTLSSGNEVSSEQACSRRKLRINPGREWNSLPYENAAPILWADTPRRLISP